MMVVFGDQSNAIRTVEYSIPTAYQNQANVHIRFVVDTDSWTNYGGTYPGDTQEGFTLEDIQSSEMIQVLYCSGMI